MIEQIIENLTKAVVGLTAQLEIQNKILLANQKGFTLPVEKDENQLELPFITEENLDDRGLPTAPVKPKRSRKKKDEISETTIPVAAAVPLPASEDDAPIMGDEGSEVETVIPSTPQLPTAPSEPAATGQPTLEDVRVAFTNYSKKHQEYKSNLALLEVFGAQRLSDLKPHQFLPLIELSKAGKIEKLDQSTINKFKC